MPPDDATQNCIPDLSFYLQFLTAVDECTNSPVNLISVGDVITTPLATGCGADAIIIQRTYIVADICGNTSSMTQTLTISDDETPIIISAPDTLTVCPDAIPAPDTSLIVAEDGTDCNSTVTVTFISEITTPNEVGCTRTGRFTNRLYHVSDMCGNVTPVTHVIQEIDLNLPTVLNLPMDLTVECDGNGNITERFNWLDDGGGAIVIDDCTDPTVVAHIVNSGSKAAVQCIQCIPYAFFAKDGCGSIDSVFIGNASFCIEDTTAPSLERLASVSYTHLTLPTIYSV